MNIIVIDFNGKISLSMSYPYCNSVEEIQEEIESTGSLEEKVIGLIKLSDDDPLGNLFSSLCGFGGDGDEDSFLCVFEEFLTKIFQLGKEIGERENKK
ncbi:MAG: hypothetical protein WC678_03725 [Parcubacteria group bacterium]|jgi:hypothetical protein